MDIFLVRHGEASASWGQAPDPGLSDLGREQAAAAARALQAEISDNILLISSPLARARETAEPLAAIQGLEVQIADEFREIPSPVPLEQRQQWLRQFMQQQWQEQGADLCQWRDRALQSLVALPGSAVVFTHFLVINAVVGSVLGRSETLHFWPGNGSITHLRKTGSGLELISLGDEIESLVN